MRKLLYVVLALCLTAVHLQAAEPSLVDQGQHEDEPALIRGEYLSNLTYLNHDITGSIGERAVYTKALEGEFGIELYHQVAGQTFKAVLQKGEHAFSSTVESLDIAAQPVSSHIDFNKISAQDGTMEGLLDATPFVVRVTSDKTEGNHYINPRFDVVVGSKQYHFQLEHGAACMGCAMKISFVVLSMLRLNGVL